MSLIEMQGQRFGRLTVVQRNPHVGKNRVVMWDCVCDCGNNVTVSGSNLRRGTRSCGCLKYESHNKVHGLSQHPLHRVWTGMKTRCYNPNSNSYKNYGARGICLCDEWANDFEAFYTWAISSGYREGLTIERLDNDGIYEPDNCIWISKGEQSKNRRFCHKITIGHETKNLFDWCRQYNIQPSTAINRIKSGWSEEDAITKPKRKAKNNANFY